MNQYTRPGLMGFTLAQGRFAPSPSLSSKTLDLLPRDSEVESVGPLTGSDLVARSCTGATGLQDFALALTSEDEAAAVGVVQDRVGQGLRKSEHERWEGTGVVTDVHRVQFSLGAASGCLQLKRPSEGPRSIGDDLQVGSAHISLESPRGADGCQAELTREQRARVTWILNKHVCRSAQLQY